VQCSHGSTTGAIDETALYYLRSRGVPASEATDLLVLAFLAEAIDEIEDAASAGRHPRAAGAVAGGGGAAEPMSVSRDIVATWRRPRRSCARSWRRAGGRIGR
jgi:hypothetical protein